MLAPESFELIALVVLGVVLLVVFSAALRLIEMRSRMGTLFYIKFDPYANVPREIADAVRAGQTIQAIKLYRDSTGVALKEAKDFIEEFQRRVK
jgi:hypothetical protein